MNLAVINTVECGDKRVENKVDLTDLSIHVYSWETGIEGQISRLSDKFAKLEEIVFLIAKKTGDKEIWETIAAAASNSYDDVYKVVETDEKGNYDNDSE